MSTMIFVNLPIKNLNKSVEFFTRSGYRFNPQFTDEKAACLIISDTIFAMLILESFYKTFVKKEIADTSKVSETILALTADSRADVDTLVDKAMKAGATQAMPPQDQGPMYSRSFLDLDGHQWEAFWMDPSTIKPY